MKQVGITLIRIRRIYIKETTELYRLISEWNKIRLEIMERFTMVLNEKRKNYEDVSSSQIK